MSRHLPRTTRNASAIVSMANGSVGLGLNAVAAPMAGFARQVALAILIATAATQFVAAQDTNDAATRKYAAAVGFQRLESFDLAVGAWSEFLKEYPQDARAASAAYYLGVAQYQLGQLGPARDTLTKLVQQHGNFELLDSAYLFLGVSQFGLASADKPESYQPAAATFQALAEKFPEGKHHADAMFYQAECAYMAGDLARAEQLYQQTAAKHGDHTILANVLYALGVAQEELNKPAEAGKTYDQFLHKFREHELAGEVFLRRGGTLLAQNKPNDAVGYFAEAAAVPGSPLADLATFRQAEAYAKMRQFGRAAEVYSTVVKNFPQSEHATEAALAAGKSYYLAEQFDQAVVALTGLLGAGGAPATEAAHWTARCMLRQKRPAEAFKVAESAAAGAGDSPFAASLALDQADALYDLPERRAESIARYATVATKFPESDVAPQALYMAAFAALEAGQFSEAEKHTAAFLAKHGEHERTPDVLRVAAETQLQLNKPAEAEKLFQQFFKQYPDHADGQRWRIRCALAMQMQKKHAEAIGLIEPVLKEIREPELLAEAEHVLGQNCQAAGQTDQAVAHLEAALNAKPDWQRADETMLALAGAYQQQDQAAKAIDALSKLIAGFPESPVLDKAFYRLGEVEFAKGNFAAAEKAFGRLVTERSSSPLAPHALHELACSQLNLDQPAAAEKTAGQLLEQFPQHELALRCRYVRGLAREQQGNFAPAVEDLKAVLAGKPPADLQADAQYVLGLSQLGLEQNAEAAQTLSGLLTATPDYSGAENARYQLAWALMLSDRRDDAVKEFAKLAKEYPESSLAAEAQHHIGEFFYDRKDYEKAAVAYYDAMNAAGKTPLGEKAAHKLAWAYYHSDDFAGALKTFGYQVSTYANGPLKADAQFMVGECYFEQEKYAEALAAYTSTEGLKNADFQALALLHAGESAGQLKQWQQSHDLLAKCVQQFPESPYLPQALCEQGWALQNLGKPDDALKLYEQVIAKTNSETAAKAQFMIGEIQFEKKQHAEAVKSFFKVVYGYSVPRWQSEACYEAARCFEVLKKPTQAISMYEELVSRFPESQMAADAEARLAELKP